MPVIPVGNGPMHQYDELVMAVSMEPLLRFLTVELVVPGIKSFQHLQCSYGSGECARELIAIQIQHIDLREGGNVLRKGA